MSSGCEICLWAFIKDIDNTRHQINQYPLSLSLCLSLALPIGRGSVLFKSTAGKLILILISFLYMHTNTMQVQRSSRVCPVTLNTLWIKAFGKCMNVNAWQLVITHTHTHTGCVFIRACPYSNTSHLITIYWKSRSSSFIAPLNNFRK